MDYFELELNLPGRGGGCCVLRVFFFWNRYIKKGEEDGTGVCVGTWVGVGIRGRTGWLWTCGQTDGRMDGMDLEFVCRCVIVSLCVGMHVGRFILTLTLVLTYVLYIYLLYLTLLCSLIFDPLLSR